MRPGHVTGEAGNNACGAGQERLVVCGKRAAAPKPEGTSVGASAQSLGPIFHVLILRSALCATDPQWKASAVAIITQDANIIRSHDSIRR